MPSSATLVAFVVGLAMPVAATARAENAGSGSQGTQVGLGIGVVIPQQWPSTLGPALSLALSVRLPLGQRWCLEPEAGYWARTPDIQDSTSKVLNVGVNMIGSFGTGPTRAWAGFGVGLHLLRYQGVYTGVDGNVVVGDDPFVYALPRLQLLAGLDHALSHRSALFLQGRIDTSVIPGEEDLPRQWKVHLGVRLRVVVRRRSGGGQCATREQDRQRVQADPGVASFQARAPAGRMAQSHGELETLEGREAERGVALHGHRGPP